MAETAEIVHKLREQAAALSDGPMASTMERRVEWQAADEIERLLTAAKAREGEQRGYIVKDPDGCLISASFSWGREYAEDYRHGESTVVPVAIRETEEPAGE